MSTKKADSPFEDRLADVDLPCHPFFETAPAQPGFAHCIDAIDRAVAVIELSRYLKLDEEEGGLSPTAAFGYYWLTEMARSALAYASRRLVQLDRRQEVADQQASACLASLCHSLPVLSRDSRECYLDQTAARMALSRRAVERYIEKITAAHQR